MSGKIADDEELRVMGREVASAMIKGSNEPVKPTDQVPLATLLYVADAHQVQALDPDDMKKLARAMDEALEEAEKWNETDAQADLASKGG